MSGQEKLVENILGGSQWFDLKMGDSWKNDKKLHTIRYDFKPASIDLSNSSIEFGPSHNAAIVVPDEENQSVSHKLFQGNVTKPFKDCLLVINPDTMQVTLERLHSHIQVKKTRNETRKRQETSVSVPALNKELNKRKHNNNNNNNLNNKVIKNNHIKTAALSDESDDDPNIHNNKNNNNMIMNNNNDYNNNMKLFNDMGNDNINNIVINNSLNGTSNYSTGNSSSRSDSSVSGIVIAETDGDKNDKIPLASDNEVLNDLIMSDDSDDDSDDDDNNNNNSINVNNNISTLNNNNNNRDNNDGMIEPDNDDIMKELFSPNPHETSRNSRIDSKLSLSEDSSDSDDSSDDDDDDDDNHNDN